jgi:putative redox protein
MTIEARLVQAAGARRSLTLLGNGRHGWLADVDRTLGGTDAAPDPHDLLDSALAACTALTLELYIRRKGWAVAGVHVTVAHEEGKTDDGRMRYALRRSICIDGALADDDRVRLLDIANKCPIHRILSGEIRIATELA